jgi:hypothetical protein
MELDSRATVYFAVFVVQFAINVVFVWWLKGRVYRNEQKIDELGERDREERRAFKKEIRDDMAKTWDKIHEIDKIKETRGRHISLP